MTEHQEPKTVLQTILEWSESLSIWQRDALRRVVILGEVSVQDKNELVCLLKKEKGDESIDLQAVPFAAEHLPANPGRGNNVCLKALSGVSAVNGLAAEQRLEFEESGITVIYGNNGTGKSGYARVLKKSCRARQVETIHSNVYSIVGDGDIPTAMIDFKVGEDDQPTLQWQDTEGYVAGNLSAISVFDSSCASVHVTKKNEVAYRPFGLDVPEKLAECYQAVKGTLEEEKKQLENSRQQLFVDKPWHINTKVGEILNQFSAGTDLVELKKISRLDDVEKVRFKQLQEDLSKDLKKASQEQSLKADVIKGLVNQIKLITNECSDEKLIQLHTLSLDATNKRKAATLAAGLAFGGEAFDGIGSPEWKILWDAARSFSAQVTKEEAEFPPVNKDALCVLCLNPLGNEGVQRFSKFDGFITQNLEKQAGEAEVHARDAVSMLEQISISTATLKNSLGELDLQDQNLCKEVRKYIAIAKYRRSQLLKEITNEEFPELHAFTDNPLIALHEIENRIRSYSTELANAANEEGRKKLEYEHASLQDREALGKTWNIVEKEYERLTSIKFLESCLADTGTTKITRLGNTLADEVITPKIRDSFFKEIVVSVKPRLPCKVIAFVYRALSRYSKVRGLGCGLSGDLRFW